MNADLWQNYQQLRQRDRSRSPSRVFNSPLSTYPELKANIGLYAQDQWAFNRFTINYGIRYEYLSEEIPAQDRVAGRFAPALHYDAHHLRDDAGHDLLVVVVAAARRRPTISSATARRRSRSASAST